MAIRRRYVIPGEVIVEGNYRPLVNVLRTGNKLISTRVGMAEVTREGVRVVPLSGPYIPKTDDIVIGKVVDYSATGWDIDINSCFHAYLPAQSVFGRDFSPASDPLAKKLAVGDVVVAQIVAYDRSRDPLLSISGPGLGKVPRGEIMTISTTKVPRLIGKKGNMIKAIASGTGCRLDVGQNGIILVTGPPEGILKVRDIIGLIEEQAHRADLAEKVLACLGQAEGEVADAIAN